MSLQIESGWQFDQTIKLFGMYNEAKTTLDKRESDRENERDIAERSRSIVNWSYDETKTETELEQCVYWLHFVIHEAGLHIEQCYMWGH